MQKFMKYFFIFTLPFVIFITSILVFTYTNLKKNKYINGELKIFCWGQYISDGSDNSTNILNMFEQETKVKISAFNTFDSSEQFMIYKHII